MADYTLSAKITADSSQFSRAFDDAKAKLKGFDKSVGGMSDSLISGGKNMMKTGAKITAMSAPLVMFGRDVFKTGMEFEASMSNVQAITNATDSEMVRMTDTARELGSSTRYSASEASEAMGALALSGMNTDQVIASIPDTLNLATAAGIDLGRSAQIVSGNLNAFGLEANEASRVSDVFAKAQANSAMDAEQLAQAMEKVAPMASSMGHEIEGTSALLGILANNEIKGARAGTMLSRVYKDITDSAQDGKIAIGEHSIEVFDANGNMRDMTSIVADVADATEGMSDEQRQAALSAVFQGQSIDALLPLLNSGSEELLELEEALYGAEGAGQEMADIMDDNMAGGLANLNSSFEEFKLRLFDVSEGPMTAIIDKITGLVDWFAQLDDKTLGVIMAIGGVAVVVGPLIMMIGMLSMAIGAIMTPIGAVIGIIAAVIAAGVALYLNWDTVKEKAGQFRDYLSQVWENMKTAISNFLEPILGWFSDTWNSITEVTKSVWNGIKNFFSTIWDGISTIFNFGVELVKSIVESGFTLLKTIVRVPLEVVKAIVKTVWNYIGDATTKAWNKVKDAVMKPVNAVKDIVSRGFNAVKSTTSSVWNSVTSVISNVWSSITSRVSSATSAISSTISGIWNSIRSFTSSVWNSIKSAIMGPINSARDTVSSVVSSISSTMSSTFNSIRSTATSIFNSVKSAMTKPIQSARDTISGVIDSIKGFFSNLRLKFPKIEMPKLPRFSLKGKFSLMPPSVPKLSVNWNAKGAIFTRPTVLGGNQGVGEAGAEAVLPIEKLGGIMADTMTRMGYNNDTPSGSTGTNVYVELKDANIYDTRDISEVAKELATEIGREIEFG